VTDPASAPAPVSGYSTQMRDGSGPGRLVVRWQVLAGWALTFLLARMVLGGSIATTGSAPAPVGSVTPLAPGMPSFVWVPAPRVYVAVWFPAWLGAAGLGLLLGAAAGIRRAGCCATRRGGWLAGGGGLVAALAGFGCCGLALPAAAFGGLAALAAYVRLADVAGVGPCGWSLDRRVLQAPQRAGAAPSRTR
jgi:hypothetical protein